MCSSSQTDHTLHLDVKEAQKKKEQIELQMKRKAEVQQQLAGGGVEPSAKSARCTKNLSLLLIVQCLTKPTFLTSET